MEASPPDHDMNARDKLNEILFIYWYCFIPDRECSRCCVPGSSYRPDVDTDITAPAVMAHAVSGAHAFL